MQICCYTVETVSTPYNRYSPFALIYYITIIATGHVTMSSRFKSNNFIAVIIALLLMGTGFVLSFLHRQSESRLEQAKLNQPAAVTTRDEPATEDQP